MMKSEAVFCRFFIANLQLAEVVEPAVRNFDDPTARLEALVLFGFDLLAARTHMRDVTVLADDGISFFANIPRVSA